METNLDAMKKRIKKLLALSKSKNENEASVALEKANALMEEFKITEAEAQIFVEGKTKAVKSNSPWRSKLAQDVAWLYMAKPVWETETGSICFFGEEFDVFMATEMYSYLQSAIERIARVSIRKNAKKKYRDSFKLGCAVHLGSRIIDLGSACSWAPQREQKRKAVGEYIKNTLATVARDQKRKPTSCEGIAKGISAAKNISLNRQTTGSGGRSIGYGG